MSEKCDVLIVGAGASGAVSALRLAQAGLAVVVLEQGGWPDRSTFKGDSPEWELSATGEWAALASARSGPSEMPLDLSQSDIKVLNWNGVGGATVLWQAVWPRFRPGDFRTFSEDGVGRDWPLDYRELEPFYDRVDRDFGVSGLAGDPNYPQGTDYPLPPLPLGTGARMVAKAHGRLGWHWWPHPCAILSSPYDGRRACVQRGACTSGCNEGAKASTDITHWPKFRQAGGRIITHGRASRITIDRNGLATGAEWIDKDGAVHHQAADIVLCAANGIGTPRLLLMSETARAPRGLANSSGLVGRGLMMHPTRRVIGYFREDLESWQGAPSIICIEHVQTDRSRGFVRGCKWSLGPMTGPLQTALREDVWGQAHGAHMAERFGHGLGWNMMAEDLPHDGNRIELSGDLRDSSGLPGAKVFYTFDDNSRRMMDWNQEQARRSLVEAGAWLTEVHPGMMNAHLLGTARMGDDPATSVVDRWGMAHDVANLGVVDGSIFVTSSSFNPTPTIAALALRTAEHILRSRRNLTAPDHRSFHAVDRALPATRPVVHEIPAQRALTILERERLALLADALLPAQGKLPSASGIGVAGALADKVLALRPDAIQPLLSVLSQPLDDALARIGEIRKKDPAGYRALVLTVAGGYYLHPKARAAVGYPGQMSKPFNPRLFEEVVSEGLLDHVVERDPAAY